MGKYYRRVIWRITWTAEIEALLGTVSDSEIAARLQCSTTAVRRRRFELGIAASKQAFTWTPEADALLGTATDRRIAQRLGVHEVTVRCRRRRLKIGTVGQQKKLLRRVIAESG